MAKVRQTITAGPASSHLKLFPLPPADFYLQPTQPPSHLVGLTPQLVSKNSEVHYTLCTYDSFYDLNVALLLSNIDVEGRKGGLKGQKEEKNGIVTPQVT